MNTIVREHLRDACGVPGPGADAGRSRAGARSDEVARAAGRRHGAAGSNASARATRRPTRCRQPMRAATRSTGRSRCSPSGNGCGFFSPSSDGGCSAAIVAVSCRAAMAAPRPFAATTTVRWLNARTYRASVLRRLPLALLLAALALICVALMEPVLPYSEGEVRSRGLDMVMVLDLSSSMQEEMEPPSMEALAKNLHRKIGQDASGGDQGCDAGIRPRAARRSHRDRRLLRQRLRRQPADVRSRLPAALHRHGGRADSAGRGADGDRRRPRAGQLPAGAAVEWDRAGIR